MEMLHKRAAVGTQDCRYEDMEMNFSFGKVELLCLIMHKLHKGFFLTSGFQIFLYHPNHIEYLQKEEGLSVSAYTCLFRLCMRV